MTCFPSKFDPELMNELPVTFMWLACQPIGLPSFPNKDCNLGPGDHKRHVRPLAGTPANSVITRYSFLFRARHPLRGDDPPKKTPHPNTNTVSANNFGTVCANCPPISLENKQKTNRKSLPKLFAQTVFIRGQKLNPNIFFSNFSGASGISRKIPGISRQKSLIPWVSRDIPNFLAPTLSRGRPPPHQKISGLKSLGLGSFFVPDLFGWVAFP